MSTKCTVLFDNNPNGVYYSGQQISGTAELITSRPKTIRSIHLTINGYSEVRWAETIQKANQEGKSENVSEPFTSTEHYLTSQTFVYGQSGGGSINLPAGKYLFTFQGFIPTNAPTTLNGQYGQIRYEIVVTIDRPLRYDNVFKQPFTVISPLDLNLNPIYANPIEKREEKTFLCGLCCGNNDPIIVKVNIPFSGYAPGQKINFKIVVDNKSKTDCSEIKLKLIKNVKFTCRTPSTKSRLSSSKICEKKLDAIPKQESKEFLDYLQIPSTTPSTLKSCSIIEAEYILKIITKISGLHTNLEIPIPLTIGTVPLYISANEQNGIVTSQPGGPQFTQIAPPSYEDDVNRTNLFQNNDEYNKFMTKIDFVPKYPVFYNFGKPGNNGNVQPTNQKFNPVSPYPPANNLVPSQPNVNPTPSPSQYPRIPTNTVPVQPTSPPYIAEPAGVIWDSPDNPGNNNAGNFGWRN